MIVRIVGSVGPGASPMPTIPASVSIWTSSPEADSRVPPGQTSGSRIGVRTAVVSTLVILTRMVTLGPCWRIVNHPEIVYMSVEPRQSTPSAAEPPLSIAATSKSLPRAQQIAEVLRSSIIAGRYEPGERLIEASLSAELGTSRGPVREALRQLENEGLVMSFPYRGAVVLGVSDEEVQEVLIPIRLTLERYAFVLALEKLTDDDFAELGKQIWLMEQAGKAKNLLKLVEADLAFHEIVIAAAGQLHAVQIWRTISPRIRAYFYRYERFRSFQETVDEHRLLLEALQTRDPETVLAQLERHIDVPAPKAAPKVKRA